MKLKKITVLLAIAFSSGASMAQNISPAVAIADLFADKSKSIMSATGAASLRPPVPNAVPNGVSNATGGANNSSAGSLGNASGFSSNGGSNNGPSGTNAQGSAGQVRYGPWETVGSGVQGTGGSNSFWGVGNSVQGNSGQPVAMGSPSASSDFSLADFGKIVTIASPLLTSIDPKLGQIGTIVGGGIGAYSANNFSVTQIVDGAAVIANVAALVKPTDEKAQRIAQQVGGLASLVNVVGKTSLGSYVNNSIIGGAPIAAGGQMNKVMQAAPVQSQSNQVSTATPETRSNTTTGPATAIEISKFMSGVVPSNMGQNSRVPITYEGTPRQMGQATPTSGLDISNFLPGGAPAQLYKSEFDLSTVTPAAAVSVSKPKTKTSYVGSNSNSGSTNDSPAPQPFVLPGYTPPEIVSPPLEIKVAQRGPIEMGSGRNMDNDIQRALNPNLIPVPNMPPLTNLNITHVKVSPVAVKNSNIDMSNPGALFGD
jgi:hypothetical protein